MAHKKAILTGGLGFIGFNFYELYKNDIDFLVVDKKGYAANPTAEKQIKKLKILDIAHPDMAHVVEEFQPDFIFNFAAESHVDRSIIDARVFLESNVVGTHNLLEIALKYNKCRFVQVSTDEVYGSLGAEGVFTEETPMKPNSPYSASKAAADCFVRAYYETHKLDAVITRCSNNYGPWQFPEKLIPLMICNAVENKKLPVYGTGKNVRDWIYVEDHCRGIMTAAEKGRSGEVYNFGGRSETPNIDVVKKILQFLSRPESLIEFVTDRKGHDFRYAIDFTKATRELHWKPLVKFEEGLRKTVEWNLAHMDWLQYIRSDDYRKYYEKNYARTL